MSRTYSKHPINDADTNKATVMNEELAGSLQEFQGKLDQHNMPLRCVEDKHILDNVEYLDAPVTGSEGQVNSYYISDAIPSSGPWIWDYTLGEWQVGWNPLFTKMGIAGSRLSFAAKEGMIKGSVVVTIERRTSLRTYSGGGATDEWSRSAWIEVGVFVNDRLVANSGSQFMRYFTYDLPFSSYVGNTEVTIDVRWRGIEIPAPIGTTGYVPEPLNVHASTIWVRGQKR